MLGTFESVHVSRINEILRLLKITAADRTTPARTAIVSIRLQDILLELVVRVDSGANIAHGHSEDTLPRSALATGVRPSTANGVLSPGFCGVGIVVVTGDIVRIKGRVDDVLQR